MQLGSWRAWTGSLFGVAIALVAASCVHNAGDHGMTIPAPTLSGTAWRIEQVGDSAVTDASKTGLRFDADGRASGSTGCNDFTGRATIEGSRLAFSPLVSTRKACEEPLMDQESRIFAAMRSVKSYQFAADGRLALLGADGRALLRLARAE